MAESSVLVPYQKDSQPLGEGLPTTVKAVAQAVQGVTCALYKDFPGFMTGEQFASPFAPYTDGFLQDLCGPPNQLPPPRSTPFNGGQCLCRNYRVTMNISITGGAQFPAFQINMFGPIKGVVYENFTNAQGNPARNAYLIGSSASCQGGAKRESLFGGAPVTSTATITSVVPVDGLTDGCGDAAPSYPVNQPSNNSLTVNVPIQVTPTLNIITPITVFAPVTNFSPQVKVGPINVDIGLGGLVLDFDTTVNIPGTNPVPIAPTQPPPGTTQKDRDCEVGLAELLRFVKRIRECQECDKDYNFLNTGLVSGQSNSVTVPAGGIPLTAVLNVTASPTNKKSQPGGTQPQVLYAGWGWWEGNSYLSERFPIDAGAKIFHCPKAPALATFRYTMYTGFTASAQLSYKVLKNPLPVV